MRTRSRRTKCTAALGLAGITLFPVCAVAATGDVDVQIKNHSATEAVGGPNVSIQAEFTSVTLHKITRVELLVDGRVVGSHRLDEAALAGSFIFAWDTTNLTNDVHTISARAYDETGHSGTAQLQLFVNNQAVERAMPVVRVSVPHDGAVVSGQFLIEADATLRPNSPAVKFLELQLDNDLIGAWTGGYTSAKLQFNSADLPDGPHTLKASTTTVDGQRVDSPPIIVIVDKHGGPTEAILGSGPPDPAYGLQGLLPHEAGPGDAAGSSSTAPVKAAQPDGLSAHIREIASDVGLPPGSAALAPPTLPATAPHPKAVPVNPSIARAPVPATATPTFAPGAPSISQHPAVAQHPSPAPPAADPVLSALEPSAALNETHEFQGFFWHSALRPEESLEPAGPGAQATRLHPAEKLHQPKIHSGAAGFRPVSVASLPIVPEVAQATRVIVVEAGSAAHVITPTPHVSAVSRSATSEATANPVFVPLPLVSAPNSPASRPMTPPVLISLAPPRTLEGPSRANAAVGPSVFLPVPMVVEPGTAAKLPGEHGGIRFRPATAAHISPLPIAESSPSAAANGSGRMMPAPFILVHTSRPAPQRIAMLPPRRDADEMAFAGLKAHKRGTPAWLRVAYDKHWMNFDVRPMMVKGIPTAPFRTLFERDGGVVTWRPQTGTVIAENRGKSVQLKIGSRMAKVDHQTVQMDVPAFVRKGRTMVSVGFVRQAMDLDVHFDRRTGEIFLTSKRVVALALK